MVEGDTGMMPWWAPGPYPAVAVCPSGLIHRLGSLPAYRCHLGTQGDGAVFNLFCLSVSLARVSLGLCFLLNPAYPEQDRALALIGA